LCFQLWYALSKTLAEAAAWEFVRENNIDMVAIHPGTVLGPLLHPDQVNGSVQLVLNIINGKFSYLKIITLVVMPN
jgi:nucleoside-diphosphate-sugar epimerase